MATSAAVSANNNWINTLYPNAPTNPGFQGLTDDNGKLLSQYQLQSGSALLPQFQTMLDQAKLDPTALNALTSQATSTEPSAWAKVAQLSNTANTANQMGAAGSQGNTALATANSSLASHGGLRQGAAQNLANQSQKSVLAAKQGVLNQSNLNDLSIQGQDATNKMGMLGQAVTGAQGAATLGQNAANLWSTAANNDRNYSTGVDQSNIATLAGNNQNQNAFNANTYNANMSAWAANQQANASADAAKHSGGLFGGGGFLGLGSWICTEVGALERLDTEVVNELKALRNSSLKFAPGRAMFYLNGAGGLLGKLKTIDYDFSKERPFVLAMAELHKSDPKLAVEKYWDRVNELFKEFEV